MAKLGTLGASLAAAVLLALPGTSLALEQQQLVAADGAAFDNAGSSVAIQGNTAVVGAPGDDDGQGAVYVYTRTAGSWAQSARLTASDGVEDDALGTSVAIDGDTIVAGAPGVDDDDADMYDFGAVYRFDRSGAATRTQTGIMLATDRADGDGLGNAVAIDGDVVVAGAQAADAGSIFDVGSVYTFDTATLAQQAKLTVPSPTRFDMLGSAVAIDGDTIVAGALGVDLSGSVFNTGAVYTFARTGAATRTPTAVLTASDAAEYDELGRSVAIDGDTIVAGAAGVDIGMDPDTEYNFGAAYAFDRTGAAARTERSRLAASDGQEYDELGTSVAIEGDTIAVGVPGSSYDDAFDFGAVYLYPRAGTGSRTETQKVTAPDGDPADKLGNSLAISGTRIIAGAPFDDRDGQEDQGSALVLSPDGYADEVLDLSPGGYWRFGEPSGTALLDSSPNANNGTYLGGVTLGAAGAIVGDANTAASYDGVNDTGRVPDANSLDVGSSFTMEGWIKRSSTAKTQELFNKGANGLQLSVMNAGSGNKVFLRKAGVTTIAQSTSGVPADGRYHYVAATMNGTGATAKIYVDGADVTQVLAAGGAQSIANTAFPLTFGIAGSAQAFYDEFALYDEALPSCEIGDHYTTATGGPYIGC